MPERDCVVFIPSGRNPDGHYQSEFRATSTLDAAAQALARHEDYIRRRKLVTADFVPEDGIVRVVVRGPASRLAFNVDAPGLASYRYRVARVRQWMGAHAPPTARRSSG